MSRQYSRSSLAMMPEGAEVRSLTDTMELILCKVSRNELVGTSLISGRYTRTDPQGYEELQNRFVGAKEKDKLTLTAIKSKGKFIYFTFSDPAVTIWSTLGLTGGWTVEPRRKHIRLALHFEDVETKEATSLYFYDMRNFGTLKVSFDAKDLDNKLDDLGYDWLCDEGNSPTEDEFLELCRNAAKRKRPLAVFLMDQKKTSGIGNYVLAEVLYRAGIHPFCSCADLNEGDWIDLYGHIHAVLHSSYLAQRPVLIDANGQEVSSQMMINDDISNSDYSEEGSGMTASDAKEGNYQVVSKYGYRKRRGRDSYNNEEFSFRIYSRKVTPTGQPVTRMTGTHKRTIWFSPSEQEKYKPEGFVLPE